MIRILHLSDPHFGAADQSIAEEFLRIAPSLSPDLTILSGDLTMRARKNELAPARDFVKRLPAPRLLIPGNHDIPGFNQPAERFYAPFRRYKRAFGKDLEPEWIGKGLHVVSLNSSRAFGFYTDWSEGRLSQEQLRALRFKFAIGPENHFRILVLHHPLLAPEGMGREVVKPLPGLLAAVNDAGIDLILCGHFHQSHLATAGLLTGWKCVVSQAPTVCSTRLQGEPQGFHEIHLFGDRGRVLQHAYENGRFQIKTSFRFIKDKSGWRDAGTAHTDEILST